MASGTAGAAAQYPQYAEQITAAAKSAFLSGDQLAYLAGILAVLGGAALVFFKFPKRDEEVRLLVEYHATDNAAVAAESANRGAVAPIPASAPA